MRRILLLIPSMAGVGGTERMVQSLSTLLAGPELEVHQASLDDPAVPRHFDSAAPFHPLGPIPTLPLFLRPLAYALSAWRLRKLKKSLGIDITISNLWGADLISVLAGGRDRKIALCHINVVDNPANRRMVQFRPLVAAVYRRFDRVVAVSEPLAEELKALYRLPDHRIRPIDNFVGTPGTLSCMPEDGVQRFVWCGRFSPEKNVEGLLHAWASFAADRANVQLVLLGEGPLLADMRLLSSTLGLDAGTDPEEGGARVVFTGSVPDPVPYMLGARALLLSSRAEGLPLVILEALSVGLPVLAADCLAGGVRSALLGVGRCRPTRSELEVTPMGALLPVPEALLPGTLVLWREVLRRTCEEEMQWQQWRHGALQRAGDFTPEVAREKWLRTLDFEGLDP